jgi:putative ATPase
MNTAIARPKHEFQVLGPDRWRARAGSAGADTLGGVSLFDDPAVDATRAVAPLAVRMRPRTLDEIVGQQHLLGPGTPLRRMVEAPTTAVSSIFLWGPPGTGKTTLAYVVSQATDKLFVELSAVNAGVKEVRQVLDDAKQQLAMFGKQTVLFIDEVHRFSKTQQDALLPAVENRLVTLIAATTENPYFSVISPLLSRSLLLTLQSLSDDDVRAVVRRALEEERGLNGKYRLERDAEDQLIRMSGGDARRALTYLEAAAGGTDEAIALETLAKAVDRAAVRYDRDGDQHYDVASAFIKSVRGSDVDAGLHYLARMIEAGEDPRFIARRLVILASEDIGLADPTALTTAVAAHQAVAFIGFPEASLTLAQAVIALATAPKSNAVTTAIAEALADVRRGLAGAVPPHLRDSHYAGAKKLAHGAGYVYPHDDPAGVVQQQYAPDAVADREYYRPTQRGAERTTAERLARIRAALQKTTGDAPISSID